jgi:hypothetical protein
VPSSPIAFGLYVASSLAVLVLAVKSWRSGGPLALRYSALLFATVLVSPHLTVYDLAVLAPAFLLLADSGEGRKQPGLGAIPPLLYLLYGLFLIGPLAIYTHVQLSVAAMCVALWLCWMPSRTVRGTGVAALPGPLSS